MASFATGEPFSALYGSIEQSSSKTTNHLLTSELGSYTLTCCKSSNNVGSSPSRSTAKAKVVCVLVPRGRAHEYVFNDGIGSLVEQIHSSSPESRLLVVAVKPSKSMPDDFFREENYVGNDSVLMEGIRMLNVEWGGDTDVDICAVREKDGYKVVMEDDVFIVEEEEVGCDDDDDDGNNDNYARIRRLFFKANPGVCQSEGTVMNDSSGVSRSGLFLHFDYHKAIIAAVIIAASSAGACRDEEVKDSELDCGNVAVIGLGSGSLSMHCSELLQSAVKLKTIELSREVSEIATKYFGFLSKTANSDLVIGDGMDHETYFEPGSLTCVVVDVDSKDQKVGMSCPPECFISPTYLQKVKTSLSLGGAIIINVSARDEAMWRKAYDGVSDVFCGEVTWVKGGQGSVNKVLLGFNGINRENVDAKLCLQTYENIVNNNALKSNNPIKRDGDVATFIDEFFIDRRDRDEAGSGNAQKNNDEGKSNSNKGKGKGKGKKKNKGRKKKN